MNQTLMNYTLVINHLTKMYYSKKKQFYNNINLNIICNSFHIHKSYHCMLSMLS